MSYINGTTSQQIKSSVGEIEAIIVNSHSTGTIRLNDGLSGTTSAGVKATGVLTITSTISDGETVLIGDKTYTFKTSLTSSTEENEVLIGASDAVALDNLKSAINATAGGGTTYGSDTQANPNVVATTNTNTAQTVGAYRVGTYGNSISTTETMANGSFAATTLASGADASPLVINTFTPSSGSSVINMHDLAFNTGLYLTKSGTIDYTVIYK